MGSGMGGGGLGGGGVIHHAGNRPGYGAVNTFCAPFTLQSKGKWCKLNVLSYHPNIQILHPCTKVC